MYLLSYNYVKCIHHGKLLLSIHTNAHDKGSKPLAKSTLYNTHSYLAEANCMLGRFSEALECLERAEGVCIDHDAENEKPLV